MSDKNMATLHKTIRTGLEIKNVFITKFKIKKKQLFQYIKDHTKHQI